MTALRAHRFHAAATAACVVAALATAGPWWGVVRPARAAAAASAEATRRLSEAEAAAVAADARRDAVLRREEALTEQLRSATPPGRLSERNARLAGLLARAEAAGLEVVRLEPGEPEAAGGHARVRVELEARAAYAEHHAFLGSVAAGPADLSVTALGLGGGQGPTLAGLYRLLWVVEAEAGPADPNLPEAP